MGGPEKIYRLGNGNFKTYFRYAGGPKQNTHSSFDAAYLHLDREFSKLDTNRANSLTLHPLDSDVRTYRELEQLLKQQGNGASLREAVQFFLAPLSSSSTTENSAPKTKPRLVWNHAATVIVADYHCAVTMHGGVGLHHHART